MLAIQGCCKRLPVVYKATRIIFTTRFANHLGTLVNMQTLYTSLFYRRYVGEVGDVVIGRITEVGNKRWKVDAHAMLDSALMLSCVNLPGGELV